MRLRVAGRADAAAIAALLVDGFQDQGGKFSPTAFAAATPDVDAVAERIAQHRVRLDRPRFVQAEDTGPSPRACTPNDGATRPARTNDVICRIWHGYTTPANADDYDELLRHEVIAGIEGRSIHGFREIQVLRRDAGDEVEFVTIMWFDSLASVQLFGGDDYEAAVVPPAARQLLARFDERSQHYEVRDQRAQ